MILSGHNWKIVKSIIFKKLMYVNTMVLFYISCLLVFLLYFMTDFNVNKDC